MSSLADRIRGIVAPASQHPGPRPSSAPPARGTAAHPVAARSDSDVAADLERTLAGSWRDGCFVVERKIAPAVRHGREAVGTFAECLDAASTQATLYTGGVAARPPFVFFDIETTGLSGGAGTHVFLVGCGWFENGSFVTRQFLLTRYADERPMLETIAAELGRAGALVSFNGKSFDAPVLETRYLFHRLNSTFRALPHVDVLHPARRFWKTRESSPKGLRYGRADVIPVEPQPVMPAVASLAQSFGTANASAAQAYGTAHASVAQAFGTAHASVAQAFGTAHASVAQPFRAAQNDVCSLIALEKQLLGVRRVGDVPGFEIPARYFQFVRTGDSRPLAAVLEHNRYDLLTLAALTARLFHLTMHGPDAARDAREALALGHVYMRGDLVARALDAYARAVEMTERGIVSQVIRIESLRALALTHRRERNYAAAAASWRRLLDTPGCPAIVTREATAALAVHHEHRERDLCAAKAFALRSLELDAQPAWTRAVQHRLARLEKKLKLSGPASLLS